MTMREIYEIDISELVLGRNVHNAKASRSNGIVDNFC